MVNDPRVQKLLEEVIESESTPEEVCSDCPEFLNDVREGLERLRNVEAHLEAIFPSSGSGRERNGRLWFDSAEQILPKIPGYEVENVLGRGGIGVVFRARQLNLKRTVALKMLLAGSYAGPRDIAQFRREAETIAALRHPNIVQIYDNGEHAGRSYFTMEFVDGGDLSKAIASTPQSARKAATLVATLASAVEAAHRTGVLHRDLKPANILLTSEGIPKITDFGLARRLDGNPGLTLSGTRVGTPSYMAPEQATGRPSMIGPSADIYSLGAILYEMLTGRPPFRGETASETERQVISEDPVPPTRLNGKVPRDLETICLKCLHKVPDRRYPTAAALVADLERFQNGEPIVARRVGPLERSGKWVRRHPALSTGLATSVLLTIILVGGAAWLSIEHAKRRHAVEVDLNEVTTLQERAQWLGAKAVLDRAEARLDGGGAEDIRAQLTQARRDLDLVIRLDRIHLRRLTSGELPFYRVQADREYAAAFREAGLGGFGDVPSDAAARIAASAVRGALVAALDDWAVCNSNDEQRRWLVQVINLADPDETGWRERIRDSRTWDDPQTLADLADAVPAERQSVSALLSLGERLRAAGGHAPAFLKRVQSAHPADFWANLTLGDALVAAAPAEASGYYRAALASRPSAAVGYTALGDALNGQHLQEEALEYHRKAVTIDPSYARAHTNLGNILNQRGRADDAIACYRKALDVDSNYAWAHFDLAGALRSAGRADEALSHYRQFHALDSTNSHVANILRADLVARGRGEEVRLEWKKALEAGPTEHDAWFGYAELCLFLGDEDEYRWARQELLRHFGNTRDPYVAERVARASLLLSAEEKELEVAAILAQQAVDAKQTTPQWVYPYFLFARGLAEYRRGQFDIAITTMREEAGRVMGPAPRLVIAMAEYRKGEEAEARKTLATEMVAFNWGMSQVGSRDHWIWHVLRREAEAMILPQLPAFLQGEYEPLDNDERLAFVGMCQVQRRYRAEAQLYAAALASEPQLSDEHPFPIRYNAARAAALAGCGRGQDAHTLDEAARAQLRDQARQWLRAELASMGRKLEHDPGLKEQLLRTLVTWKTDSDLAGLRERSSLIVLSAGEREQLESLWTEVDGLIDRAQLRKR
jgi:serine/threonine-protein kinase